jgi:drug/metabolite transporter (DMT)-like permease
MRNKYIKLFGGFVVYSFLGVLSKLASSSENLSWFLVFVGLQIICMGIYAINWQQVLKEFSLVTAMACKGVVVILSLIWAVIIFGERITIFNILGSIVIVLGIYVVSNKELDHV